MRIKINTVFILSLFINFSLLAQVSETDSSSWFNTRDYGKYFKADLYAPNIRIDGGICLNHTEYNIDFSRTDRFIPINETVLGGDIPIYQKLWDSDAISFSLPLSFSVWFDFSESITAPILNTDYRFAFLEINYQHKFNHTRFRNVGVKFIPFFHESTHIGDEITLARVAAEAPILRVNVSYESMNIAFTLNDPLNQDVKNHMFRIGAKFLWNPTKGWYSFSAEEGDTTLVEPSQRWIEPYLQYEYQSPTSIFSFGNSMFVLSADLSFRVKFGYPYAEQEGYTFRKVVTGEQYLPSFNLLAGWHFYNSVGELSNVGLYLRAYTGLNYHGQFRNLPMYQFFGVSVIYDI